MKSAEKRKAEAAPPLGRLYPETWMTPSEGISIKGLGIAKKSLRDWIVKVCNKMIVNKRIPALQEKPNQIAGIRRKKKLPVSKKFRPLKNKSSKGFLICWIEAMNSKFDGMLVFI